MLAAVVVCIAVFAVDKVSQDARARCRPQLVICGILYGGHVTYKKRLKQPRQCAYRASAAIASDVEGTFHADKEILYNHALVGGLSMSFTPGARVRILQLHGGSK